MVDELGDVLFQVYFLSLLLEERGAGDLSAVAERMIEKLIRRHPHVFGELEIDSAEGVVRNWDAIKRDESGSVFGDLPETLPALLYARKILRRASNAGLEAPSRPTTHAAGREAPGVAASAIADEGAEADDFVKIGRRLFELVAE